MTDLLGSSAMETVNLDQKVTYEQLHDWLRAHDIDPTQVRSIALSMGQGYPTRNQVFIRVDSFVLNEEGKRFYDTREDLTEEIKRVYREVSSDQTEAFSLANKLVDRLIGTGLIDPVERVGRAAIERRYFPLKFLPGT